MLIQPLFKQIKAISHPGAPAGLRLPRKASFLSIFFLLNELCGWGKGTGVGNGNAGKQMRKMQYDAEQF